MQFPMEKTVDAMSSAYNDIIAAVKEVMEAKQLPACDRTAATEAALAKVHRAQESFIFACDQADDMVQYAQQRLPADSFADAATGSGASSSSLPDPIGLAGIERARRIIKLMEAQAMENGVLPAVAEEGNVATEEASLVDAGESDSAGGGGDLQAAEDVETGSGGGFAAYWESRDNDDLLGEEARATAAAEDDEILGETGVPKDDAVAP